MMKNKLSGPDTNGWAFMGALYPWAALLREEKVIGSDCTDTSHAAWAWSDQRFPGREEGASGKGQICSL